MADSLKDQEPRYDRPKPSVKRPLSPVTQLLISLAIVVGVVVLTVFMFKYPQKLGPFFIGALVITLGSLRPIRAHHRSAGAPAPTRSRSSASARQQQNAASNATMLAAQNTAPKPHFSLSAPPPTPPMTPDTP